MTLDTDREKGLYRRYKIERLGGTSGKHQDCFYYVLDLVHDRYAFPALLAYADACEADYPVLATDLRNLVRNRASRL